jgi:hypothetical protein
MVLCALAVAACTESTSTEQDLAACQLEAIKVYPHWRADQAALDRKTDEEPMRPGQLMGVGPAHDMGDFTRLCMKAKGYEYGTSGNDCPFNPVEPWRNSTREQCYRKATR